MIAFLSQPEVVIMVYIQSKQMNRLVFKRSWVQSQAGSRVGGGGDFFYSLRKLIILAMYSIREWVRDLYFGEGLYQ